MRKNNPRIQRARAAYRTAGMVAATRTPRANPSIDVAPLLVGQPDILSGVRMGVDLFLGWSVPLTGRLRMQDDLNAVTANAALVDAARTEREEYLLLRGEMLDTALLTEGLGAIQELENTAIKSAQVAQQAAQAGTLTELDVRLLQLEAAGVRAETASVRTQLTAAQNAVAQRINMSLADTAPLILTGIPSIPHALPSLEKLREAVLKHHPRLSAIRAEYQVAEKELRLEMARRYPDLGIGVGFEDEVEDQLIGLPLGIEIPIFDRNQQDIARAYGQRCQVRAEYQTALAEILGLVEARHAAVEKTLDRLRVVDAQLKPADETQDLAQQILDEGGSLDMLRFLEVLRTTRRIRIQHVEARLDAYDAWSALEVAVGSPLLHFASAP